MNGQNDSWDKLLDVVLSAKQGLQRDVWDGVLNLLQSTERKLKLGVVPWDELLNEPRISGGTIEIMTESGRSHVWARVQSIERTSFGLVVCLKHFQMPDPFVKGERRAIVAMQIDKVYLSAGIPPVRIGEGVYRIKLADADVTLSAAPPPRLMQSYSTVL